jgi:hypothetical protein
MGRKLRARSPIRDYPIELGAELRPRRPEAGEELVIRQEEAPPLAAFHTADRGTVDPGDASELLLAEKTSFPERMKGASGLLASEKGTTLRRMVVGHQALP